MSDELSYDDGPGDHGYDLLMPFVVTASHDGPYHDESFVAGWELGRLDAALRHAATPVDMTVVITVHGQIRTASVAQLELIAMRHGFAIELERVEGFDEWTRFTARLEE